MKQLNHMFFFLSVTLWCQISAKEDYMLFRDVLHILKDQVTSIRITNHLLYTMLFTDESPENAGLYTDKAKKGFSSRGLMGDDRNKYCNAESFPKLVNAIHQKYLPLISQPTHIYNQLKNLVKTCKYLPTSHKEKLLASCSPDNPYQLSRFIAACLLCASYQSNHLSVLQEKGNEFYTFGIDFMNLDCQILSAPLSEEIWKGSQQSFLQSHAEGNRFHDLNIIERLLPKGYVSENVFKFRGKEEDGTIRPLKDICSEDNTDIAVTGEGGIGKTTFLQQLLEDEFLDSNKEPAQYKTGHPIPVFIELRRCPALIENWYEDQYKKTNFITRYIGQLLENHSSLAAVSQQTLTSVEKELQRIPSNGLPQYLLLLDGFNEVSVAGKGTSQSCRALLSNEITVIHKEYPNVRIIATSRETQSAYFTSSFRNVNLIGLEKNDIKLHLEKCNFSEASIGFTLSSKELVKCLRIPLFLCIFSCENQADLPFLPETRGEILYSFFHRNSFFYNTRSHAEATHTNPLDKYQTALVLDFILPYIGWGMEHQDIFSLSETQLIQTIQNGMDIVEHMILSASSIPYDDFSYDPELLNIAFHSLIKLDKYEQKIISCAFDYLGLLYQYNEPEKNFRERRQYAFIHHYFRDYFSAVLDIQFLRMLPAIDINQFMGLASVSYTYNYFLNSHYWNQGKKELISEVLMEHHNKPVLNSNTENWYLPSYSTDEQHVLTDAINFCQKYGMTYALHYLLHNILMAIVYGRQELSGMDLTGLNFKHYNIFSIPCSKKGATSTLTAQFDHSILPDYFFEPEDHVNSIEEYAYSSHHCFTLDDFGTIKCWDIFSGCLEYILQSGAPNGPYDYSPNGLMKISFDGQWLAAKVYNNKQTDHSGCLYVFNLQQPEQPPVILQPSKPGRTITSFSFTFDSQSILYLSDRYNMYCFDIKSGKELYSQNFPDFMKQTDLYAESACSTIYAFSGEYDCFDSPDFYPESEDEEPVPDELFSDDDIDTDDDWDESSTPTPCTLLKCDAVSGEVTVLYNFTGEPAASPIARYFPSLDCFILFNEQTHCLERFSCSSGSSETVWCDITMENGDSTPSAIQYCPESPRQCYIIYPDCCYHVDLISHQQNGILMKYNVSALNKLINDDEDMEELIFYANIVPSCNRFIIRNSENTYEWDTANDTLRRRYNTALYDCRDLLIDKIHHLGIFVHQFNGVSIFSGNTPKLVNAFCYPNAEYYVSGCAYHESTMNLALMFSKASHEYIEIINIRTGKREIIYSTLLAHETLKSVQFHPSGKYLLITLATKCLEYNLNTSETFTVKETETNELFIDGNYTNDSAPLIEIAIVEHFNYDVPRVEPHCDHFVVHRTSKNTTYTLDWRYYMPTLTPETAKNFLHYSYDIGAGASYTKEEYQTYWCTQGFFLHDYPSAPVFQDIQCIKFNGKRSKTTVKKFEKLQMLYCRHDFPLANQYRTEKNCNSYAYCSDDFSEVIQIQDHRHIQYWHNLLTNAPCCEKYVYDNGTNTSDELSYAYVDTIIPWDSDSVLACYEQYNLMQLKKSGHGQSIQIPYTPGICIMNCSFYNVSTTDELLEIIKYNGGKF